MDVNSSIDNLLGKCTSTNISQKRRRNRIEIYARGLQSKLKQVQFAFNKLQTAHNPLETETTSSIEEVLSRREQIEFYADCFWTFLHSAFEILAQIINQIRDLNFDEESVSFKNIKKKMESKFPNDKVTQRLMRVEKSYTYININKYRHCSLHRRPIMIICDERKRSMTTAYDLADTTGAMVEIQSLICDDPLFLNPKFHQKRDLIEYSEKTLERAEKQIVDILKDLL